MNYQTLANQGILALTPYQPGKNIEELSRELGINDIIKLASNENPLGASPKAIAAAQQNCASTNLYPDCNAYELKNALAQKYGINSDQIILGNGSDNVMDLIGNVFINPYDEILISQYAFASYQIIAHKYNGKLITIPAANWGADLLAFAKAITNKSKLIFLANPNNPTGTWFSASELKIFLQQLPQTVIVVLDEAYCEYMQSFQDYPDALALLPQFPNLIITRTFSKAYGLAGLRVGYGITHPEIIELIDRMRMPFAVSTPAQKAAKVALTDNEHLQKTLKVTAEGLTFLRKELALMHIKNIAIAGNFVTIDLKRNATAVYQALLQQGIIVRPLNNYQMPNFLRITVGLPEQNKRFIAQLQKILSK